MTKFFKNNANTIDPNATENSIIYKEALDYFIDILASDPIISAGGLNYNPVESEKETAAPKFTFESEGFKVIKSEL